ncbi:MAG: hypothetical protein ACM34A_01720 [Bacillota bacterium]
MTGKSKEGLKSTALDAIYSAACGLYSVGAIDKKTMREYEEICRSELLGSAGADETHVRNQDLGMGDCPVKGNVE